MKVQPTTNELLTQAVVEFQKNAPELSEEQVKTLRQCWYEIQDVARDLAWKDEWLDENGNMTDLGMREEADETLSALGIAMLKTYGI